MSMTQQAAVNDHFISQEFLTNTTQQHDFYNIIDKTVSLMCNEHSFEAMSPKQLNLNKYNKHCEFKTPTSTPVSLETTAAATPISILTKTSYTQEEAGLRTPVPIMIPQHYMNYDSLNNYIQKEPTIDSEYHHWPEKGTPPPPPTLHNHEGIMELNKRCLSQLNTKIVNSGKEDKDKFILHSLLLELQNMRDDKNAYKKNNNGTFLTKAKPFDVSVHCPHMSSSPALSDATTGQSIVSSDTFLTADQERMQNLIKHQQYKFDPTLSASNTFSKNGISTTRRPKQFQKTKFCPYFIKGFCANQENCCYAHSMEELQPLPDLRNTKLCSSVKHGEACTQEGCTYAHSIQELKPPPDLDTYKTSFCFFWKKSKCFNGLKCRFAHGEHELRPKRNSTRHEDENVTEHSLKNFYDPQTINLPLHYSKNNSALNAAVVEHQTPPYTENLYLLQNRINNNKIFQSQSKLENSITKKNQLDQYLQLNTKQLKNNTKNLQHINLEENNVNDNVMIEDLLCSLKLLMINANS